MSTTGQTESIHSNSNSIGLRKEEEEEETTEHLLRFYWIIWITREGQSRRLWLWLTDWPTTFRTSIKSNGKKRTKNFDFDIAQQGERVQCLWTRRRSFKGLNLKLWSTKNSPTCLHCKNSKAILNLFPWSIYLNLGVSREFAKVRLTNKWMKRGVSPYCLLMLNWMVWKKIEKCKHCSTWSNKQQQQSKAVSSPSVLLRWSVCPSFQANDNTKLIIWESHTVDESLQFIPSPINQSINQRILT